MSENDTARVNQCLFVVCAAPAKLCLDTPVALVRLRGAQGIALDYIVTYTNATSVPLKVIFHIHTVINCEPLCVFLKIIVEGVRCADTCYIVGACDSLA